MAPRRSLGAGPLDYHERSVRLSAEECREIELIILSRIIHRRRAAMRVEALVTRSSRVFGHRLRRTAFRLPGGRALLWWAFELLGRPWRTRHRSWRRLLAVRSPTETNRSQSLH